MVCYSWKPWSGVLSEKAIVRGVIGIWDNHPVSVEGSHHVSLSEYVWNQPPSLRCDEGIAVFYLDSASEFSSLFAPFDIAEIQKGWRELPSGQSLQFSPRVPATMFPCWKTARQKTLWGRLNSGRSPCVGGHRTSDPTFIAGMQKKHMMAWASWAHLFKTLLFKSLVFSGGNSRVMGFLNMNLDWLSLVELICLFSD